MSNVWAKVKHEIHEIIPPTIFFLISFYIVVLNRALMAKEFGLQATSFAAATVGALLVAKVVVIADLLPAVNRFPEKPLVYNVLWKSAIYIGASLLAHYLEHLVPLWWRLGFSAANEKLWSERVGPLLGGPALARGAGLHLLHGARADPRDRTRSLREDLLQRAGGATDLERTGRRYSRA
jgi:hypothetical protein